MSGGEEYILEVLHHGRLPPGDMNNILSHRVVRTNGESLAVNLIVIEMGVERVT